MKMVKYGWKNEDDKMRMENWEMTICGMMKMWENILAMFPYSFTYK